MRRQERLPLVDNELAGQTAPSPVSENPFTGLDRPQQPQQPQTLAQVGIPPVSPMEGLSPDPWLWTETQIAAMQNQDQASAASQPSVLPQQDVPNTPSPSSAPSPEHGSAHIHVGDNLYRRGPLPMQAPLRQPLKTQAKVGAFMPTEHFVLQPKQGVQRSTVFYELDPQDSAVATVHAASVA